MKEERNQSKGARFTGGGSHTPEEERGSEVGCAGCAEDENPTGMVAWWYDFLEQKMHTLCAVGTTCFDMHAIERLIKQRVYVLNVMSKL